MDFEIIEEPINGVAALADIPISLSLSLFLMCPLSTMVSADYV